MEFRLVAETQYRENYGDAVNPHWKSKGGSEYLVATLYHQTVADLGTDGLNALVERAAPHFCYSDSGSEEYLLNWELLPEGKLTYDEDLFKKEDGSINPEDSPRKGAWTAHAEELF